MGREEGGGFRMGKRVYLWRIHVDIWQNQYNIVKLRKKKKKEVLLISPCDSLELCIQLGISFPFSLAFHFPSFFSYF